MVTSATVAADPSCADCQGGGEINGVPCRSCQRKPRKGAQERRVRRLVHGWLLGAAGLAGTTVRVLRGVPGVAGAAAVTIGAAMLAHSIWPVVPMLAVGLVVGGVFALLIDRNL